MIGLVRVGRDRLFVLRLAASLEIRIAQIQTVLVDLDVGRLIGRTAVAASGEVAGWLGAPAVGFGVQLHRSEPREQPALDVVHLIIDSGDGRLGGVGDRGLKEQDAGDTERREQAD